MNRESLLAKYHKVAPLYTRVANNTKEAIEHFLNENNIPFLTVVSRVKDFDSFYEKISRKNYSNPFEENEDFCGVRVILYYISDLEKVNEIISNNYDVKETEDKSDSLELNEFGYRSNHMIIKIKDSWCVTPNYSNLNDLKIELQVRTVLMHAWAEIEHKLGYKNEAQIPKELQRKLYLMSAKLEDADAQFQEIKISADKFKSETVRSSEKLGRFTGKDLNLDSAQALLTYYFPDNEPHTIMTSKLLDDILECKLSIDEVIDIAEKTKQYVDFIEKDLFGDKSNLKTTQANLLSYGLEAFSENFKLSSQASSARLKLVSELSKKASNNK
jgi:ppGpp synthetase/RelA/SpoT-type nucleotidyltranferase